MLIKRRKAKEWQRGRYFLRQFLELAAADGDIGLQVFQLVDTFHLASTDWSAQTANGCAQTDLIRYPIQQLSFTARRGTTNDLPK